MFEKIPPAVKLIALLGILMTGPIVVLSLILGGVNGGVGAVATLFILSIIFYVVVVRRYT